MRYKYYNLSLGYTGKHSQIGTLNSQFYGLLFQNNLDVSDDMMLFVQRVPKQDFFRELCELETSHFDIQHTQHIKQIIQKFKLSLTNLDKNPSSKNVRRYINWANVLLRHGCFDELISHYPNSTSVEVAWLKETAIFELALSRNQPLTIKNQLLLIEDCINRATDREKILLLTQIIVNHYRHSKESCYQTKINDYCDQLLECLEKYDADDFHSILHCSVGYRGIAFADKFNDSTRSLFLKKAETLARSLRPTNNIEHIIAQENLFNCLQTVAKWNISQNEINNAESNLLELIQIDPYDSTGFSECGFFYLSNESYEKAANYFQQALQLGPPGTGMNAYYYAKCLEQLGQTQKAFDCLHQSTQLDKYAVSPWLDLIDLYIDRNDSAQAKQIATHLFNEPILHEQLENEEKNYILCLIN